MDPTYTLVVTRDGRPESVAVMPALPENFKKLKTQAKKLLKNSNPAHPIGVQIFGTIGTELSAAGHLSQTEVDSWRPSSPPA